MIDSLQTSEGSPEIFLSCAKKKQQYFSLTSFLEMAKPLKNDFPSQTFNMTNVCPNTLNLAKLYTAINMALQHKCIYFDKYVYTAGYKRAKI